jgi:hypothetical protein
MTLSAAADLDLTITANQLRLRLERSGDDADLQRGPFAVALDQRMLTASGGDPATYGAALRELLFSPDAAAAFRELRAAALATGALLRVRLHLPADLHHLRWETLLDPASGRALALDSHLHLSRYLSADDYAPVTLRPRGDLRALIAVAAPRDYADYDLAAIDAEVETAPILAALSAHLGPQSFNLGSPSPAARETGTGGEGAVTTITATWDTLSTALRDGYDIVYLVAHGTLHQGNPWLFLVDDQGNADRRRGGALADLLRSLGERRPRLIVLASCASAGDGYAATLASLGPQLAQAGVPAVLAMQGNVQIATVQRFAPVLFSELMLDSAIDRAVNMARLAVADQPDWWMPVLYTRLKAGRIWAEVAEHPLSELVIDQSGQQGGTSSGAFNQFGTGQSPTVLHGNIRVDQSKQSGGRTRGAFNTFGATTPADDEDEAV